MRITQLPITGIKIDQSFVRPLTRDFRNLDLLITLIRLAEQRGLECIVEGVETDGIVGSIGDTLVQGYTIAKPMSIECLRDFLRQAQMHRFGPYPGTLHGWYAKHIARTQAIRTALCSIPDFLDILTISDGHRCPLHAPIAQLGGDEEIAEAHLNWHKNYALYAEMVHNGVSNHELITKMETQKERLRTLVQRKLGIGDW